MSYTQAEQVTEEQQIENEREYYKDQARILGLTYRNNLPTEDLKNLVKETLAERAKTQTTTQQATIKKLPQEIVEAQLASTALVRCTVTCLDPSKAEWQSMVFTVGNDNIPPVRRQIPVNGVEWHVEKILLDFMKSLTYVKYPSKRVNGRMVADIERGKKVPLFQIIELPPLTEQELKDLAEQQRQNGTGQQEN